MRRFIAKFTLFIEWPLILHGMDKNDICNYKINMQNIFSKYFLYNEVNVAL